MTNPKLLPKIKVRQVQSCSWDAPSYEARLIPAGADAADQGEVVACRRSAEAAKEAARIERARREEIYDLLRELSRSRSHKLPKKPA